MSGNVIRQDMVQISYDFDDSSFKQMTNLVNEFAGFFNQAMQSTQENINNLSSGLNDLISNFNHITDSIDNIDTEEFEDLNNISDEMSGTIRNVNGNLDDMRTRINDMDDTGFDDLQDDIDSSTNSVRNFLSSLRANIPNPLYNCLKSISGLMDELVAKAVKFTMHLAKEAVSGVKKLADGIGKTIAVSSGATAAATVKSISTGMDFESKMSQVAATAGITNTSGAYQGMANKAKEMGRTTQFSAAQSAEALNYLALAGYKSSQACAALPTVLDLAAAGGMELAAASDMITDGMSALGREATQENLKQFGDQMAKTSQTTNTSVAQLGEAILTVGGTAKSLHGETAELDALLGVLANNGIKGSEGGTAIRNIILSLESSAKESGKVAKTLKKLGVSVYGADKKMRPINEIFNDLNASMANMTDAEKSNIKLGLFKVTDMKSVNALLGTTDEAFKEIFTGIKNSDDAMGNMARTMNDNLKGSLLSFNSALEGVQIAIFEGLGSSNLRSLVDEVTGWLSDLTASIENEGIQGLAKSVGSILSNVAIEISELLPSFMQVGTDILSNLIKGIQENKDIVVNGMFSIGKTFVSGILEILPQVLDLGVNIVQTLATGILNRKDKIKSLAINIGIELVDAVFKVFNGKGATTAQLERFGDIFYGIIEGAKSVVNFVSTHIKPITSVIVGLVSVYTLWKTAILGINATLKISDSIMKAKEATNILLTAKEKLLNSAVWQSVTAFGAQAAALLANPITWIVAGVVALAAGIALLIKNWSKIKPVIISVWNSIKETFGKIAGWFNANVVQPVANFFKGLFEKIIDTISGAVNKIKGIGLGVITGITDFFSSVKNSIASAISNIFNFVSSHLGNLFNAVKNTWKNITDKISSSLQNIWSNITSKFTAVLNWILNLRQKFIDAGKNIMQGLINGITSKISEMAESVKRIGTSVLGSVRNIFGIHSPSKEMFKLGWFIGEGLNRGIENTKKDLQNTVFSISGSIEENIIPFPKTKNNDDILNNNDSDFPAIRTPENSPCLTRNFYTENNTYSPVLNLEINGTNLSTRELKRLIKESFKEFEQESNESFIRRNPRLTYV